MDPFEVLNRLLQMGWPAIVLGMIYVLWLSYEKRTQAYIDRLEKELDRRDRIEPINGTIHEN